MWCVLVPADRTSGTRLIRMYEHCVILLRTNICGVSYTLGLVQWILNLLVLLRESWLVRTTPTLSVLWFLGPPADSTLYRCRYSCDTDVPWFKMAVCVGPSVYLRVNRSSLQSVSYLWIRDDIYTQKLSNLKFLRILILSLTPKTKLKLKFVKRFCLCMVA